ncbi:hypothetical protein C0992_013231, partial [Termitomyces sp. T32_za158]
MPLASTLRLRDDQLGDDEHLPTADMKLYLPSAMLGLAYCDPKFQDIEWRLRFAQAHETLYEIRRAILLRSQMLKSKNSLVRGQKMLTRSQALLKGINDRIDHAVEKYNIIYRAVVELGAVLGKTSKHKGLRELVKADTGGITAEEDMRSEGTRTISWIWKLSEVDNTLEGEGRQE